MLRTSDSGRAAIGAETAPATTPRFGAESIPMSKILHSARAVVLLAVLAILIVTATTILLLWDLRRNELTHSLAERDAIADLLVKQVRHDLNNISLVLKVVQELLQSPHGVRLDLGSPEVFLLLGARVAASEPTSSIFVTDAKGTIVNTSLGYPPQRIDVSDRDYFRAFSGKKAADLFIGHPLRNRLNHKWTIYFSRELRGADGSLRGVLVAAVPPSRFEDLFATLQLDMTREMSLHMNDGTLMASQPRREESIGTVLATHSGAASARSPYDQELKREVVGFPMHVRVANDEDKALDSWRDVAKPMALGALTICLSIIGITVWLTRELMREESLQQALLEAEFRHTHTVASVMDAIIAIDERQDVTLFNPAAERMFGLTSAEAVGRPLVDLIPDQQRGQHRQHVEDFLSSGQMSRAMAPRLDIVGLRRNGERFPIEATISRMVYDGNVQMTAVLRDITERRRTESELRQANLQLRALSAALQDVREKERLRISRELHDELGQQLTGLKLEFAWLSSRLREGREVKSEDVDQMRVLLESAIASVRRISTELRPLILDDLGFAAAVSWLAGDFSKRLNMPIRVDLDANAPVSDPALATALFRIVQESLTNVVRHAHASQVEIRLTESEGLFKLTVKDDGRGMDVNRGKGIGLESIRERAMTFGGSLKISSALGEGTTIEINVPATVEAIEDSHA